MKNIKLEDVILGDLNEFLTSINNYALLTEDVEIKYEQPDLKNQNLQQATWNFLWNCVIPPNLLT
jgi:hypothetical protein